MQEEKTLEQAAEECKSFFSTVDKHLEALKRADNPDVPLQKINMLCRLQNVFHILFHHTRIIDNKEGSAMFERDKLLKRIAQLEKENAELKESITL